MDQLLSVITVFLRLMIYFFYKKYRAEFLERAILIEAKGSIIVNFREIIKFFIYIINFFKF